MDVCGNCAHFQSQAVDGNLNGYAGPAFPNKVALSSRLNTFEFWPPAMPQKPKELAEAGFFYLDKGDMVQCYSCGGGLNNWNPEDSPFEEHAKWFKDCSFLNLVKGPEFIRQVQAKTQAHQPQTVMRGDFDAAAEVSTLRAVDLENANAEGKDSVNPAGRDSGFDSNVEDDDIDKLAKEDDKQLHRMKEENERLRENNSCKICFENKVCIVFTPCGHLVTCEKCAPAFFNCPFCRTKITNAIRTYLS